MSLLASSPGVVASLALVALVASVVFARRTRGFAQRALVGLAALAAPLLLVSLLLRVRRETFAALPEVLRFGRPRALPVAAAAVLFALLRRRSLAHTGLGPARANASWSFGALALLLAALASAAPEWGMPLDRLTVVLAIDRSRSMELVGQAAARARDEEAASIRAMRDDDRIARVVFGAEAATEDPAHPSHAAASTQEVLVGAEATDVGAALRRSLAEIPPETAGRVVLVSDGASNRGDVLSAAAAAAAAGVPVDVLPLRPGRRDNLRVESVRTPATADENETFELRVVTRSDRECAVQVRVRVDGHVAQRGPARVRRGEDVLHLRMTAPAAGLHRYEVDLTADDARVDAVIEDNRGGTFLRVRGASSVLVLEGDEGRARPLADALRQAAFRVDEHGGAAFPEDLAALAAYDLVVLSDVPARALSPTQMQQLATYVRELGGGLLLMGGDRSMGPGGYSRTPVEEVSPVSFDLRQERRRASLAQVIAIDFSGSMAASVASGETKLQLANEAAARSASLLGAGDRLGVMHVDTAVHWTVPLSPIGNAQNLASVMARIRAVGPSGGGIIVPVTLTASYEALAAQPANLRHLLLFADGSDAEEINGQHVVVAEAYRRGITTSVVSLGRGSDTPELEHLSREGHGRFYLVEDATRLPAVFAQETVLAARSSIREEPFAARLGAPDPVTRGIDFAAAPPLRGWVVTIPKPRASILLRAPDDDPLLAAWQVGVGRVAAFTSDAKDRWGSAWLAWPDAQRLWAELARSLSRRTDSLVRVEADASGGVLHVHADARTIDGYADSLRRLTARVTLPDGSARELALDPTGAGTYAAELVLERPGAIAIAVRDERLDAVVANAGALLLEGEELRPARDAQLLERIAAMTGGRVRATLTDVFLDRAGLRRAWLALDRALLAAAALCMFLALCARRLAVPEALARALDALRSPAPSARAPTLRAEAGAQAPKTVGTLLARRREAAVRRAEAPRREPAPSSPSESAAPALENAVSPAPRTAVTAAPSEAAPPRAEAPRSEAVTEKDTRTPPVNSQEKVASSGAPPAGPATGSKSLDALLAKKRKRG